MSILLEEVARKKLRHLQENHKKRELAGSVRYGNAALRRDGKTLVSFSCNDYLGLSQHPLVKEAAIKAVEQYGTGAGASRLVTGNHPLYEALETQLAAWKNAESCLVFGSGYLANTGIIPALMDRQDLIIADKLVHACLMDGARLSGAKLLRFKHNDVQDADRMLREQRGHYRHCLIITEEIFSMDGDIAPLEVLGGLARRYDSWLMVDGAHGINGGQYEGVDIAMGTLSKAFGSYGGYVCAKKAVIDLMKNQARSFIFTTGLPPAVIASASAALHIMRENPDLLELPLANARMFTRAAGLPEAQSPIVPLILGSAEKALAASAYMAEKGFLVTAIRPPTVPENTARLRFAFSALHRQEDILTMAEYVQNGIIWG